MPPRDRDQVLVVDDDPGIRVMLAEVLMEEGYEVLEAGNGVEALSITRVSEPCAIILDLNMPVMDGSACYREIRARGLTMPVVIVSAINAVLTAQQLGATAALNKPFDIDELVAIVASLVRASRN